MEEIVFVSNFDLEGVPIIVCILARFCYKGRLYSGFSQDAERSVYYRGEFYKGCLL